LVYIQPLLQEGTSRNTLGNLEVPSYSSFSLRNSFFQVEELNKQQETKRYNMSDVKQGTVKWFNDKKGFGFITPSDGGKDLFVHMSNIVMEGFKTLSDGQAVDYTEGEGEKGPLAENVTPQ
jgi:CspA family cold shock protein